MFRRAAFTLVELLVVIGIICVLIAITIPVLSKARDSARAAACASNMKQIYVATSAYAMDNSDMLYYACAYQQTTMNYPYAYLMVSPGVISYTQGVLWSYIGPTPSSRQSIFTCPSDRSEPPNNMPNVVRNFSYSLNGTLNWDIVTNAYTSSPSINTPAVHTTAIISPSHKILIWEEVGPNDGWCGCMGDPQDYPTQRHGLFGKPVSDYNTNPSAPGGGWGNQCFADGHVELLQPAAIWNNPFYCNLHAEQ